MKTAGKDFRTWRVFCISAALPAACDDGRIQEQEKETYEEGYSVRLIGAVSGVGSWTDGYSVVLAGFEDGNDYAVISKALPLGDEAVDMELNGIGQEVDELRLCVVNRLRESVFDYYTWWTEELDLSAGALRLPMPDSVAADMYTCLQRAVFDRTCVACHGVGGRAAAGLDLREGKSRPALVGQPATVVDGGVRVVPGDADSSVLYQMVATGLSQSMGIDHSDMLSADGTEMKLLKDWIDHGTD